MLTLVPGTFLGERATALAVSHADGASSQATDAVFAQYAANGQSYDLQLVGAGDGHSDDDMNCLIADLTFDHG